MDKVTYSTDTITSVPAAGLTDNRSNTGATGNSTTGYFGGGGGNSARMDKCTYSTDTTVAVPSAFLSSGRREVAATGNSTAGYFGGGRGGGSGSDPFATMDKCTYSTDTTAASPGTALSFARHSWGASSARANALPQPTFVATSPVIV